jgi:GNAT superfamily N-acetyltransferase
MIPAAPVYMSILDAFCPMMMLKTMVKADLTPELIRRIIQLDDQFTRYNNRRSLRIEDGQLEMQTIGGATCFRDRSYASNYYNRVVGFSAMELEQLDACIAFHHDLGKPSVLSLAKGNMTTQVMNTLQKKGYSPLQDSTSVFVLPCASYLPDNSSLHIRRAEPKDMETVVDLWTVEDEDKVSNEVIALRKEAHWVPEFPIYLAQVDGEVAAMGSMFVKGNIAWLGNANTLPAFRQRGCQLALLNHRIGEAKRMGCDWAISDATMGTTSQRNLVRGGMAFGYTETVLIGPAPQ